MQEMFNSKKLLLNGFFALLLGAFALACDTNSKNQTSSSARNDSLNASANTNTRTGDPALSSGQTSGQTQSDSLQRRRR
jgi:ABC-type oligopeptide transport system substrate-binding subunit